MHEQKSTKRREDMPSGPLNALTRINSTVKELFIYLYDLSPLDLDLLFIMIKEAKPLTLEQLSNKADRDKSTVRIAYG